MTPPGAGGLEARGIEKSFNGVRVLRGVSFDLPPGRTLGLVGENGAGKSTLMNILGGTVTPDGGTLKLDGQPYQPRHPVDATRARIAFIHQELSLFTNLSVAENLFLNDLPRRAGVWVDRASLHERAEQLLRRVGLAVSPDTLVESLSSGQRQLVEIARALGREARIILFDEPTTSLSNRETLTLFALIRDLQAQGIALIYISHLLEHVRTLCDDVLVLRDGQVAATGPARSFEIPALVAQMVGRPMDRLYPERRGMAGTTPILEVRGLSRRHVCRDVSFTVARGEIVGVFGLMGAGRSEVARILFGLDACDAGEVSLAGESLLGLSPQARIARGLAFLTEDRRQEGLCLEASIADNLLLVTGREYAQGPWRRLVAATCREAVARMRTAVRLSATARDEQPVQTLSGGNQQKVVLGKWLLARPQLLLLDEPTRGVDVGAKFELYQLILELADRGSGVLLISSEVEELTGLCDRILVMSQGEVRGEYSRAHYSREELLAAALPREAAG